MSKKYKLVLTVQDSYGKTKEIEAGTVEGVETDLNEQDLKKITDYAKETAINSTFVPQIDDDKILTWTNKSGLATPEPVDLNPFDEWTEDDTDSEYEWEED